MEAILIAIFSFIAGAAIYTIISYVAKYMRDPSVPFNSIYLISALVSTILVIALSTAFLIPGILPFAASGLSGDIFIGFACFSMGVTANLLLNLPLTFLLKIIASNNDGGAMTSLNDHAKKIISVITIVSLICLLMGTSVYAVVQYQASIQNVGTISTYGLSVYQEPELINEVTEINWGILDPGETKTTTVYLLSTSNNDVTLSMYTSSWEPPSARDFLIAGWSVQEGTELAPGASIPVTFTIESLPDITGITDFSYDIVINAFSVQTDQPFTR